MKKINAKISRHFDRVFAALLPTLLRVTAVPTGTAGLWEFCPSVRHDRVPIQGQVR